jgi:AAA family ATP:ADP antiporter
MQHGNQGGAFQPMTVAPQANTSLDRALVVRLRRLVQIEPGELPGLAWSAVYFFCVLAAYYIVRPIREEMGVRLGREGLGVMFTVVFFVMVAVVPLFGWLATRFKRSAVVPVVYGFFIANLLLFWLLFQADAGSRLLAGAFFVWVSVFNLFAVSLFWSLMSDKWSSDQAKRLYGCIAAGGSAGAVSGPLITQSLAGAVGPTNLLLVSAALLSAALYCVAALRNVERRGEAAGREPPPQLHDMVAGAVNVWRSGYLFKIALVVLLANLISTYFYFEQSRIVGATVSEPAARVQLFARMDLAVNFLTILAQVFLTASLMQRLGVGLTAGALPAVVIGGLVALAISPSLWVIVAVVVIERAVAFAFSNPAFRVLYTAVPAEDKYKAQNFIDTVVFRGGDAASGWLFNTVAKEAARAYGMSMSAFALLTLPLAALWLWLALRLGAEHGERVKSQSLEQITPS